ncbi:MAG: ATP-binding protein [Candidatus Krumholzibacteria bacterium]|nr:ATP-binding protein [Candidatus Krumholzibacteria bacterium]
MDESRTEQKEQEGRSEGRLNHCWEYLGCDKIDCPAHSAEGKQCWEITGHRCGDRVFARIEEKLIQCCFRCPFFKQLKERIKGRRWADITLLETLEDALIRSSKYSTKVEDLYMEVIRRSKLMNLLGEVSKIIARLDKEEDIILAILTVTTAREGLGFNRAFVFLRGDEYNTLRGKYALGPSSAQEAETIWRVLDRESDTSLEKLVSKGQKLRYLRNSSLTMITSSLAIILDDPEGQIARGLDEIRFVHRRDLRSAGDLEIAAALGLEVFCVVPIATVEDRLGLMIVDNIFTGKEVTPEDAHLLEMVVSHATTSLRAAQLKDSLKKNVESLKATYRKLKANEERMLRAERLAIQGEMTASVLHELKNPLVAIGGFTRSLIEHTELSGSDREKLEIIKNEADRLESYLGNLQSSVTRLKREEGDINQTVEDVCQLMQHELGELRIELRRNFSPDIPPCFFDQVKIHEVFLNILQNAIEAVQEGGRIAVRTWADALGFVYVEFTDSGEGISKKSMARIFTPFFTTKEDGSGLGLAFANRIVRDHGGEISASSPKGGGAVFLVKLPVFLEKEDLTEPED